MHTWSIARSRELTLFLSLVWTPSQSYAWQVDLPTDTTPTKLLSHFGDRGCKIPDVEAAEGGRSWHLGIWILSLLNVIGLHVALVSEIK